MKNLKLILLLSAVSAFSIVSCKKGDTGPQGPQGPAGPDSVMYSDWIQLQMTSINDTVYYQQLNAPAVTQGILDSGIILTYIKDQDGYVYHASDYGFYTDFNVGTIEVYTVGDGSDYYFRYVIVPGSVSIGGSSTRKLTQKDLQNMSYKDVQKLLNLSDKSGSY